jgi:hypothetical protein
MHRGAKGHLTRFGSTTSRTDDCVMHEVGAAEGGGGNSEFLMWGSASSLHLNLAQLDERHGVLLVWFASTRGAAPPVVVFSCTPESLIGPRFPKKQKENGNLMPLPIAKTPL